MAGDIIERMRHHVSVAHGKWHNEYLLGRLWTDFVYGNQWDAKTVQERRRKNKITLTLNKLQTYVGRVVGDQRQNEHSIIVHPVEGDHQNIKNVSGTKDYSLSEVLMGIIRQIEYESKAKYHYKKAFQQAVEGGVGFLTVLPEYVDDDMFDIRIKISHVLDREWVLIDPTAEEPDYSDIDYGFIFHYITKEEFKELYPNKEPSNVTDIRSPFYSDDRSVVIADYFVREHVPDVLVKLNDGKVTYLSEIDESQVVIVKRRKVKRTKVKWYKVTNSEVLEEYEWFGKTIPIVPVLGREIVIDGNRRYKSLIADAIDAQRMHNYWLSNANEKMALTTRAPWIGSADLFRGYEELWRNANTENYSYLPYNKLPDGERPQQVVHNTPIADINMSQIAIDEIKSSTGIFDASLGAAGNEVSGKAILARQRQSDTGTFEFLDNLDMAITRVGKILVEIIPKIYDDERIMRIRFPDETDDLVKINTTVIDMSGDEPRKVIINDITAAKYDVRVESGLNYATKREETSQKMIELIQYMPQLGQIAPDIIIENLDIPNADKIKERFLKLSQPAQPSPEEQMKLQEAQAKLQEEQIKLQQMQIQLEIEKTKLAQEQIRLQKEVKNDE